MKNTNCKNCLYSKPAADKNSCYFNIIEKIRDFKNITIEDNYYVIKDYLCRYGFAKNTYEANKDLLKDTDIERNILDRMKFRYYLVVDCRNADGQNPEKTINLINQSINKPVYLSIILNNDIEAKLYINELEKITDRNYGYKIHCLFEKGDISDAVSMLIDTNLRKNNSQYLWIMEEQQLSDIDSHIASIQDIIYVYQPNCDFVTQKSYDPSDVYGLFLPFEYYIFIKDKFGSLREAASQENKPRTVYYD
jgi:hypothetical protein